MKLCDPDLNKQLKASVDRYEQLPSWVKEASKDQLKIETSTKNNEVSRRPEQGFKKEAVML